MKTILTEKTQNFSIKHPKIIIIFVLALTAVFATGLFRLKIDSNLQSFLPEDERSFTLKTKNGDAAGVSLLIVAAEPRESFTPEGLKLLEKAYAETENIPGIEKGITPFNLFRFSYENRRVTITPMGPGGGAPETLEQTDLFIRSLRSSDIAENFLISCDGTTLFAYFPLNKDMDKPAALAALEGLLPALSPHFNTRITGSLSTDTRYNFLLKRNFSVLLALAIGIILLFFYFGFRTAKGVVLPLLVVAMGTLWCLGFMGFVGFKLTLMSIILPPIVLTLGSSYTIHMLNNFYYHDGVRAGEERPMDFSHTNKTVRLASLTTMIGFLSLISTGNALTIQFALAATFGILSCTLLALFFLPAVLSLFGGKGRPLKEHSGDFFHRFVSFLPRVLSSKYRIFLFILTALPVVFLLSFNRLEFNTDPMGYFPARDPVIKDMRYFTDKIGGFDTIYITFSLKTEERGAFLDPAKLVPLFNLEQRLRENPDICDTISFTALLADLNRSMEGRFAVPESRGAVLLLSRYISLYLKNASGLYFDTLADESYSEITYSLRVFNSAKNSFMDEAGLRVLLAELDALVPEYLPEGVDYTVWGKSLKYLSLSDLFKENLGLSIASALVSIFLVVLLTFRSVKDTFLSLIPLICGILANFILMAIFHIPLDMTTTMVFAIAIGVGIDDAIHFMLQYRRQRGLYRDDPFRALSNTLIITGRPIILTSVSIIAGFIVLIFASFKPIGYFGVLVVFILFASTAGTLFLLPSVIHLISRRKKNEKVPAG